MKSRGRSRGKQHRGLCTKALMRALGTRLECQHRVFVRTEKHCGNLLLGKKTIAAQSDSDLLSRHLQHTGTGEVQRER